MALSNCKKCGTLFSRVKQPICPACIKKEEAQLETASQWLRENPGETVQTLSNATNIEKTQILKWAREKRIMISEDVDGGICKRCGKEVSNGPLCDRCKLSLSHDVGQGIKAIKESMPPPGSEKRGMHYNRESREKGRRF